MDASKSFDHYANRRDLLRSYLAEYELLHEEAPEVTASLSFDAFVHFSFSYFHIAEAKEDAEQRKHRLKQVRNGFLN
ncbi:hypothetical protein [Hymenobacter baengnokdamensis]|uniref:hypothetical protein n=1 Tax=Hymenobacter baengnokdamensis TaxID=2615203 RepID=UPI001248A7E7|nr:hypothetical protein [Hymenobacter baengnokdamensis]